MKTWLHNSKAVANYSQLVPCYLFTPLISTTAGATMALFQDFPVGDWEACATEFWKGNPLEKVNPQMFSY